MSHLHTRSGTTRYGISIMCVKCFNLPNRTHCNLLPLICGILPLNLMLYKRIVKFYRNCQQSGNDILRYIFCNALDQMYSTTCTNVKFIANYIGCTVDDLLDRNINIGSVCANHFKSSVSESEKILSNVINDCINIRDGIYTGILSTEENMELIEYLCLS